MNEAKATRTRMGFLQALMSIVDRPKVTMEYVVEESRSWWKVAILILLTLVVVSVMSGPMNVQMAAEQMEAQLERLNLSEEQLSAATQYVREPNLVATILTSIGGGILALALGWVIWAMLLHFSSLALEGESRFAVTFSLVVWSWLPLAVGNLVQAGYIFISGNSIVNQGLSRLVSSGDVLTDSMNIWWVLLSSINPCQIWHLILMIVGFSVTSGFSRVKSSIITLTWWIIITGMSTLPVLVSRGLMSRFMGS